MRTLILVLTLLLSIGSIFAQDIPPLIPNTYVQDHAQVLDPQDEAEIQQTLNGFKERYNLEIGVVTVETTGDYAIADYGVKMARTYGIGAKDGEKRGILLLIAVKDRKWRFDISRHMEAVMTDGESGSIGRNVLTPKLKIAVQSGKSQDWKTAIITTLSAVDTNIQKRIEDENKPAPPPPDYTGIWVVLGIFVGIGGIISSLFWRSSVKLRKKREADQAEYEEQQAELRRKREADRKAREIWLKTPAGRAHTRREQERRREQDRKDREAREERERWLKTPAGRAYTRQQEADAERDRARRRREDDERRSSSSSYGSSYSSSSSSSSYSSSDSSSSSSFGGGSDFGGGGSDGSF